MNVLVTGSAGFLGRRLVQAVLDRGHLPDSRGLRRTVSEVRALDAQPTGITTDPRVQDVVGDIADPRVVASLVDRDTHVVFHLAAVVSGQAEADLELGLRVNLDGTRVLLDACKSQGHVPRVVFASSVAVYGGQLPAVVTTETRLTPQSSYGAEKAIGELLLNDYSRRGLIDGRALRLPTISVRPGRPNTALSSFASGIIREPLNGIPAACPVAPETVMWLLSPATMIQSFLHACELDAAHLGFDRSIIVPGIAVSVAEMVAALERVAGPAVASLVRFEPDEHVQRIADTWPGTLDASRALGLGFPVDRSFDDIVRQYIERDLPRS